MYVGNVLVATTVIENGVDMPNVNTIVVLQANRFGMSTLYQLRGRVGRCSVCMYGYAAVLDLYRTILFHMDGMYTPTYIQLYLHTYITLMIHTYIQINSAGLCLCDDQR